MLSARARPKPEVEPMIKIHLTLLIEGMMGYGVSWDKLILSL